MLYIKVFFYVIISSVLTISSTFAEEFISQLEANTIPVVINGVQVHSPFSGGRSNSTPTFADIDNDADFDLFI